MFQKLLSIIVPTDPQVHRASIHRNILRDMARMGGTLFGPVPEGTRREFFCLDAHTWVWHEEWTDQNKVHRVRTTRYDVRPHGVFKAQDGQPYQPLTPEETQRLYMAAWHYQQNMHAKLDPLLSPAI
jgi:hypothetical protein